MICVNCKDQKHEVCKEENEKSNYASCDCQHRIKTKTIVIKMEDKN